MFCTVSVAPTGRRVEETDFGGLKTISSEFCHHIALLFAVRQCCTQIRTFLRAKFELGQTGRHLSSKIC
jgi:hypothetical protein